MKIKLVAMTIFTLAVSACSSPSFLTGGGCCTPAESTRILTANLDNTDHSLAEASYSVSRSLVNLSAVAQAAHPLPDLAPPPSPSTYGMGGLTSVDWSGPIEPLVIELAKAANYRLRILGRPPAIPVLVSVYDKNIMLADVLRDVGFQSGRRAAIVVYPECRTIELRYARN